MKTGDVCLDKIVDLMIQHMLRVPPEQREAALMEAAAAARVASESLVAFAARSGDDADRMHKRMTAMADQQLSEIHDTVEYIAAAASNGCV